MIIAVDGPAAAGKGTLARSLARHFGLAYLDTGAIYRAVGLAVLESGGDPQDPEAATKAAQELGFDMFDHPDLRNEATGEAASAVAAIPAVREALLEFQRNFAENPPPANPSGEAMGAVLDGRDIGTVVCPDTPFKIFLIAAPTVRAERRVKELRNRGVEAISAEILRDMEHRDAQDKSRAIAPLVPARDAFVLDTSELDADAVLSAAVSFVNSKNGMAPA